MHIFTKKKGMKGNALITGATSGFGEAIARKLAEEGYNLIICGRRQERLVSLEEQLRHQYQCEIVSLAFDIRNRKGVEMAFSDLPDQWKDIDVLINNAGLALGLSKIQDGDTDDWDTMIDTNVKGLLYITRLVTPGMVSRKKGHIINIGSIAGKEVYPNGNIYCATKHAVDALTKAMRIDLVEAGIRVTQIAPGAAETEFSQVRFKGDADRAKQVYNGFTPLFAEDIAEITGFILSLPPHVNINDLTVMPTAQPNAGIIYRKM
jgi:3-hydroxy acid dehydrogenase / malonic semialdehyde reductase